MFGGVKKNAAPAKKAADLQNVGECLYRHTSTGGYYALVKRAGKQIRKSLKTTDRALAQRRLSEFRDKVHRLTDDTGTSRVTFAEFSERWFGVAAVRMKEKSAARKKLSLKNLCGHFGNMQVRKISVRDCEDWMQARSPGIAASTFNNERETLQAVFATAKREGLILDNPAEPLPRRKADKAQPVIPTREQFARLLETLKGMDPRARHAVTLVELLAYSGMRLGEAVALRWDEVDFSGERFTVTGGEQGTKNHEARSVPLFPNFRRLLEELREGAELSGSPRVATIADAKKAMQSACKKAGLPEFHHHSLRHFFVSNAIEQGVDFKTIAVWVGHKDGGVLVAKTYGHLRDTHSAEMAKRMTYSANDAPRG